MTMDRVYHSKVHSQDGHDLVADTDAVVDEEHDKEGFREMFAKDDKETQLEGIGDDLCVIGDCVSEAKRRERERTRDKDDRDDGEDREETYQQADHHDNILNINTSFITKIDQTHNGEDNQLKDRRPRHQT